MKRAIPVVIALTALLAGAGLAEANKQRRPRSVKALVHHVLSTLASGNVQRFLVLAPTDAEMKRYCPRMKMRPGMVQKLHKKLAKGFERCHKTIDWKRARLINFTGGKKKRRPVKECNGVWELRGIDVQVRVGKDTHTFTIDDPFVLNGVSFGVTDRPRCKGGNKTTMPPIPPPPPG